MKHFHPDTSKELLTYQLETERGFLLEAQTQQRKYMSEFNQAPYSRHHYLMGKIKEYSDLSSTTKKTIQSLEKRLAELEKS